MIAINTFVLRQTKESPYSYFDGSMEELKKLVEENFSKALPGYCDEIKLVPLEPFGFFSGVVEIDKKVELVATFEARRPDEDSLITVRAKGLKLPAKQVNVVIYSHEQLGAEAETDSPWEIISINASAVKGDEPMHPIAMMRNMLGLKGGSKAVYTAEQFAEAVLYWSTHAMHC